MLDVVISPLTCRTENCLELLKFCEKWNRCRTKGEPEIYWLWKSRGGTVRLPETWVSLSPTMVINKEFSKGKHDENVFEPLKVFRVEKRNLHFSTDEASDWQLFVSNTVMKFCVLLCQIFPVLVFNVYQNFVKFTPSHFIYNGNPF